MPELPDGVIPAPATQSPRMAVRRRLPDGSATDVVATVLHDGVDGLSLLPEDSPPLFVPRSQIILARTVPPRVVRPTSSASDLERLAARGWPGTEQARLGGWLLRAGGGWTGRANSALVAGDPGMPIPQALDRVVRFYRARALPPRLHLPWAVTSIAESGGRRRRTRSEGPAEPVGRADLVSVLDAQGWRPYDETLVLTADLRGVDLAQRRHLAQFRSVWFDSPAAPWLRVLRGGRAAADPGAAAVLSAAPADYLALVDATEDVVAIGRVANTQDWCGIAAVEVAAPWRGRGLGARIAAELLGRGTERGARFAYLQTQRSNPVALQLYRSRGFGIHHSYHYRRWDPSPSAPG